MAPRWIAPGLPRGHAALESCSRPSSHATDGFRVSIASNFEVECSPRRADRVQQTDRSCRLPFIPASLSSASMRQGRESAVLEFVSATCRDESVHAVEDEIVDDFVADSNPDPDHERSSPIARTVIFMSSGDHARCRSRLEFGNPHNAPYVNGFRRTLEDVAEHYRKFFQIVETDVDGPCGPTACPATGCRCA